MIESSIKKSKEGYVYGQKSVSIGVIQWLACNAEKKMVQPNYQIEKISFLTPYITTQS